MADLICQDWILFDTIYKGIVNTDSASGKDFIDIEERPKEIRVFGTIEQIKKAESNYNIDEVYNFKIEKKGSYWYKIYNDPEEENAKVSQKLREYKRLYQLNDNELLILRIK